jgi:hypothetical protein
MSWAKWEGIGLGASATSQQRDGSQKGDSESFHLETALKIAASSSLLIASGREAAQAAPAKTGTRPSIFIILP